MLRFRLFGFPVVIQPFFWILCVLLGLGYLQAGGTDGVGRFVLMSLIVLGSILWHELGHAWARKKSGAPHSEIMLHGFGGVCGGPGQFTRVQSVFIAAAGPGASLLLGAVVWAAALGSGAAAANEWAQFALFWLLWVNVGWAILNLLPIYPLDGGQILAGIAGPSRRRGVIWVGLVLAVGIAILGGVYGQIWIAILFGLLAWGNWQQLQGQRASFP